MYQDILETQATDGSWSSKNLASHDLSQSSAYALAALLKIATTERKILGPLEENAILLGYRFLLKQADIKRHSLVLNPGVFFSAGTLARTSLIWESSSYTTAIFLEILGQLEKLGFVKKKS